MAKKKTTGVAKKKDPKKWAAAKAEAKRRMGGKHSARAMQLAVQIYKKKGGTFEGKKPSAKTNKLKKWGKQKWTTSSGKKSEGKRRYLPEKAWKNMSAKEKKATNAAKSKGNKAGKQFVKQPKKIAKKTKRYRK